VGTEKNHHPRASSNNSFVDCVRRIGPIGVRKNLEKFFCFFNQSFEPFGPEPQATTGTGITGLIEPSNCLTYLCPAFRARNLDNFIVKHNDPMKENEH
jgi:hypothetical protein